MSQFALKTSLPAYLRDEQRKIEAHAKSYGLDFFPTLFEVLPYDHMNEIASYGGFPSRYPHWRFGMAYEELKKSSEYGLSTIYEMVINNSPAVAYLLEGNSLIDQKIVMAHVYGHVDFFKNNFAFASTDQGKDSATGAPIRKWIDAMANHAAVCRHLHLPLQSGSDRTLAAMHRGYTAEKYLEKLTAARLVIPDLAVTTDLIVGFPGETDEDFEQTLEVVAAAEYDGAYTFIFSPRPGTEAAERTEDFVDPTVVAERFERLRVVVERSGLAKHRARIGRIEEVIVEGPSKKDAAVMSGRTAQNKLVHFASPSPIRTGSFADVRILDAGTFYLRGELVEVTAAPRHRRRIPVAAG